jgi:hypothetical protein
MVYRNFGRRRRIKALYCGEMRPSALGSQGGGPPDVVRIQVPVRGRRNRRREALLIAETALQVEEAARQTSTPSPPQQEDASRPSSSRSFSPMGSLLEQLKKMQNG